MLRQEKSMVEHRLLEGQVSEAAVSIRNLSFRYKGSSETAIEDISLEIQPGEFVVVMGPSGAGKSTLCQVLNGLIPHLMRGSISGDVAISGLSTKDNSVGAMARHVGMVFQDFEAQLFSTSVLLEVAFAPENFGLPREEIGRRVVAALEEVHLTGFERRQPASLSGGQKQRLAIASVLASSPSIVCLDEPTTDLDPVGKQEVFEIANKLRGQNTTLIVVEHETPEALLATRVVLMADGRILEDGPTEDVLRKVELFHQIRAMPMQIPDLFSRLHYAVRDRPLTVDDAVAEYESGRIAIDVSKHTARIAEEAERTSTYGEQVVEMAELSHRYDTGLVAVKDVSFEIRRGEFVAVLGQNGSGKTTMIKHLNGLLRATSGGVAIVGKDAAKSSVLELGAHVGYVFQNPDHQIFSDTVFDEIAFGLRKRKFADDVIRDRVTEALASVGLQGFEEEDPFSLTKGQRQRVAVASVLAMRPDVLILDEPTTGLDYHEQRGMMEMVRGLNEAGSTIIIVTHAMWVVCEFAHRVLVMKEGQLVKDGTTREVFAEGNTLADVALLPPPIVSLGNSLGHTVLTVEEMFSISKGFTG
jgi:energy-coupling factor transporter ATP-binding protein EcfA2